VITSAKALGGGLPAGACVASPEPADTLQPGDHGSTFAGGPLASAAALAAFDVIDDPALLRRVRELGGRIRDELDPLPGVESTRGRGLMIGVGLAGGRSAPELAAELLAAGLVVNAPRPDTLRLLPPLTLEDPDLAQALEILGSSLQ
jgi:acetylornithine/N-succinyldiaminopimelate aminotransferase